MNNDKSLSILTIVSLIGWAVLIVPSVLVPHAMNLVLNPLHPAAVAARVVDTTAFRFDPRLPRTA
jgi:RES domain-containing protein